MNGPFATAEFDRYSATYDAALAQGLAATGEGKEYFAERRVLWLRRSLDRLHAPTHDVLDFGCGTGSATPWLIRELKPARLVGLDVSTESLTQAAKHYPSAQFFPPSAFKETNCFDLAFCNGVFHHIPPAQRRAEVQRIREVLRPNGLFAFWENNPWNPGTRYVMRRVAFDRDAVPLTASEARALLKSGGFEVLRTDFLFIFPRLLRCLRWMEPSLAAWPFGGQYQILCRKTRVA